MGSEPNQALLDAELAAKKQVVNIVARLIYTQLPTRSTHYKKRPTHVARAPLKRSWLALARASPRELVGILAEDGLIADLKGTPCPRKRKSTDGVCGLPLGKRRASDQHGPNIQQKTVWHKCGSWGCRQRHGVALHNPLFAGFLGATVTAWAWLCSLFGMRSKVPHRV